MKYKMTMGLWALVASLLLNQEAGANNIVVTNVSLSGGGEGYVKVRCDISWDNSWRETWINVAGTTTNWDAAWVFVKFRYGAGGDWLHASLSTNDSDHLVPAGSTLDVGLTDTKGMGVFFYRSEADAGSWTNTISLRWNYAQDGVGSTSIVDVCVHAIEMVYVAEGSFALGSGGGTSTANPSSANCCFNHQLQGPCRVGIFATTNSTRQASGATYWGIMEMSGNLWERPVTVGNANGRLFTGLHGNGVLTGGGDADVSN